MTNKTSFPFLACMIPMAVVACAAVLGAQQPPVPLTPGQPISPQSVIPSTGSATCIQPAPIVTPADYNGPFEKTIGLFTQQLERKSVHPPQYKPGLILCSLGLKDKFLLFVRGSYDPIIFLSSAFNASLDQANDTDPTFGQGMAGYSKRFAADYTDQVSFRFFKDFAYPSMFGEDPRYYRLAEGSPRKRLMHAVEHAFVAHTDHGDEMFNFSEWLGTASAVSLGNLYHPGNQRGFAASARGVGINVLEDMGFDVLREFWPEIAHKFKLPFRDEPPTTTDPTQTTVD